MGNDKSTLRHLEIDKKCVESNDAWTLFDARADEQQLSVFVGENIVQGQLWVTQSPVERAIKNLMIYRHPFILKYINSWNQHLATERVVPLSSILQNQTDIQICLGLRNILCALIFLVEQAKARHLNISLSSIYVSGEGEWRLGGFEHVWKVKDLTKAILELATPYRHKNSIDPNEANKSSQYQSAEGLEQFAFATLCEDILKTCKNPNTPYVIEFRDYCAAHLKHSNVGLRPKLSAVLLHPYFNHEFILIHSFLTELPLKGPQDKQDFFSNLIDRLHYFDENVVASQIGNLLLSRMVLLDSTAEELVTPFVLKPKSEFNNSSLFSIEVYSKHITPRIKQIFCVRDSQIRLILLDYFIEFVQLMTEEELKEEILPNLLLGIKDTNDILVAKTLRCLADLVPFLGASIVIGGNRGRLFADGRPHEIRTPIISRKLNKSEPRSITPVLNSTGGNLSISDFLDNQLPECNESYVSPLLLLDNTSNENTKIQLNSKSIGDFNEDTNSLSNPLMPERLSPDGGEDNDQSCLAIDNNDNLSNAEEVWSDWDNENDIEVSLELANKSEEPTTEENVNISLITKINDLNMVKANEIEMKDKCRTNSKQITDDINDFDLKIKTSKNDKSDEIDFFKDMEPIIKSSKSIFEDKDFEHSDSTLNSISIDNSRFELKSSDNVDESGWDDGNLTDN